MGYLSECPLCPAPQFMGKDQFVKGGSFINRLFLFTHQSGIDISWSSTVGNIAGHVAEGAGLLARRTSIRQGICSKSVTTTRTLPLRHLYHLPRLMRNSDCGMRSKRTFYSEIRTLHSAFGISLHKDSDHNPIESPSNFL